MDGTVAPPRRADNGVVGALNSQRARAEVDTTGLVVAPGFIDHSRVAAPYGAPYGSHMGAETDRLPVALDEAVAIGREAGVPVVAFRLRVASKARWRSMPAVIATIARARANGVDVSAPQYPSASMR